MRHLLTATCLTPVALCAFALPLHAETVVTDGRTAPLRTSTINAGAADDIRISSTGTVKPASGVAVTLDSNDTVVNQGTIQITGANNSTGILANPGLTGAITNSGNIILDENFTATDADNDGDIDGPLAQGSQRYGIRIAPGGTFTGNISNGGTIRIEGNDSAGIRLDSSLAGSLANGGTIEVLGNNSYGIRAGNVTGNVALNGSITTRGGGAVGAALDGNIGGALTIQGGIVSTGYRSTTVPADQSKLDADDLLQGGPALRVVGNVTGGILFDAPPPNTSTTDDDEDDDGVKDSEEQTASIRSIGSAPAVVVGGAGDIAIGTVSGNNFGIVVKGGIDGTGLFSGIAGNGMVIGGQGGHVNVAGGIDVSGSITAAANGANATALRIGSGATVPTVINSGTIEANGGGGTSASNVRGILVDTGASVTTIRNSGAINATAAGTLGVASAVVDLSGGVTLIENSGRISAGAPQATAGAPASIAIDLRANTTGATVRQLAAASGKPTSQITGNILFGSGDDLLDVAAGAIVGNTSFGAGADRLNLAGSSVYSGNVDFGGGADTLVLAGTSRLTGALAGTGGLALTVNGGTLDITNTGTVGLTSLSVGGQGAIRVNISGTGGTLYDVAGAANFDAGSRLLVNVASTTGAEGNHVIVSAGTLSGGSNLTVGSANLPFLFAGTLSTNQAAGDIILNIRRKTATELGLNRSEGSAYSAVFSALAKDSSIENAFLGVTATDQFRAAIQQMLPEHAGGAFESVTQASRATTRFLQDPRPPVLDMGGWGFFIQQVAWGTSSDLGDTAAYDVSGWGISGGAEVQLGSLGAVGLSLSYLLGKDADGSTENEVDSDQYELGAYWHGNWGGLRAFAHGSAARINFDSLRHFSGTAGGTAFTRDARASWNGTLWTAGAGVAYEIRTGRLVIRPLATIDYASLSEGDYTETGGGDGFDLIVDERSSDELAASGTVTLGYDLGGTEPDGAFFRVELEGGRREIVDGSLGATTARFNGGQPFTLIPDDRASGWLGRFRVLGGGQQVRLGAEIGAEEQDGHAAVAFRVSLHTGF